MANADLADPVATYYRALDEHDYEALESVLSPSFVQERPDRTFESAAAFVRFMREDRPSPETTHEVDDVFGPTGAGTASASPLAVRGRVCEADDVLVRFVDVFELAADGRVARLETYTR
ncbi:nuclear transport factor 2 family protein [Haloarchaeobius sp. HRN-SO-5]|uniref:nuclear transport factor 2 family protein n=1 Tax=Haloarchaeobius sp. HRN-SO-5 TaxID=3446118 RepID=UPI003EC04204